MAEGKIEEMRSYVTSWADRTDDILLTTMKRLGIGVTDELYNSVRSKVYTMAGDMVGYELTFLLHGRFRDMGVGRGRSKGISSKIESTSSNRRIIQGKGSKPAKWFARPFYGRLNALEGALGFALMEQAISSITKPLKND